MAQYTDRGRRPSNEDAVIARSWPDGRAVLAVADGLGGHSAGEVAANRALEVLVAALDSGVSLREAVRTANAAVLAEGRSRPELQGMGTTLVALLLQDGQYHVANVGDSRAYRIQGAMIEQITRDHSFVAEAVRSGELSADEAVRSPWKNALTRSLGAEPDVDVDVFGPFRADEPHIVVLCSDGLYRTLADARIRDELTGGLSLESAVRTLGRLAVEYGSDDNVTVAAIQFATPNGAHHEEAAHGTAYGAAPWEHVPAAGRVGAEAALPLAGAGHAQARSQPAGAAARLDAWGMPWPDPEEAESGRDPTGTFMFRQPSPEPRWGRHQIALVLLLIAAVLGYVALLALL